MKLRRTDIINAMMSPVTLAQMTPEDRTAAAAAIIARAYMLKAMAIGDEIRNAMAAELAAYTTARFPGMTCAEVQLAVDSGVRGELDNKDTFLSTANIEMWIRTYAESTERNDAAEIIYQQRLARQTLSTHALQGPDTDSTHNIAMLDRLQKHILNTGTIWSTAPHDTDGLSIPFIGTMLRNWTRDNCNTKDIYQPYGDERQRAQARRNATNSNNSSSSIAAALASQQDDILSATILETLLRRLNQHKLTIKDIIRQQ